MIAAGGAQKTATVRSPLCSSGVGNGSPTWGTIESRGGEDQRALEHFSERMFIRSYLTNG